MGVLGLSLILASVVWVIIRPPAWVLTPLQVLLRWRGGTGAITGTGAANTGTKAKAKANSDQEPTTSSHHELEPGRRAEPGSGEHSHAFSPSSSDRNQDRVRSQPSKVATGDHNHGASKTTQHVTAAMPPPPLLPTIQPPTITEPDEQTTPKAGPADAPSILVPTFSLDEAPGNPAPPVRIPAGPTPVVRGSTASANAPAPSSSMMPPPPPRHAPSPGYMPPPAGRLPTLAQFPAPNSAQRARGPTPNRGPGGSSSGLAPPPTHSSKPSKPSRKVLLTPGHSPLDWARISGPNSDLRGVDPSTPYLRVTPSMLKRMTGRKGKDAWMALNGKVYNVTPYADFHPGGVPELMRGAGRDGTKLFGEIHPWVNYETMLSACLVGLLVEEDEKSEMDQMD
ncbi:hypothetical protein BGZ63DRAFT_371567 [Mariannaea sp. PMI_226]|nr:hypothetical protein BGZ63DRAFT_371567 [Mariannaea sp. PMI_226]